MQGAHEKNTTSKFSASSANNNQSDVSPPTIPISSVTTTSEKYKTSTTTLWNRWYKEFRKRRVQRLVLLEQPPIVYTYADGKWKLDDR